MSRENYGRHPETKWPGFEEKRNLTEEERFNIYGRHQEVALEIKEAATREEKYTASGIDATIDLDNLKFSCASDEKHTTVDLVSITDEAQRVRVTTNDYVVYNRIKKLMAAAPEDEWLVEDLKLNRTNTAVFFVTVTCPLREIKKIFNKYL